MACAAYDSVKLYFTLLYFTPQFLSMRCTKNILNII
jgi:hypothetical protein